jgi:hypothetical protein
MKLYLLKLARLRAMKLYLLKLPHLRETQQNSARSK